MNESGRKRLTIHQRERLAGWIFLIPAVLLIAIFLFYPMLKAFVLSLQTGVGANTTWSGTFNYQRMFKDRTLLTSIKNTLVFAAWQVPIMLLLALIFASILNNPNLRCKKAFMVMLFLPCTMSLVSYAIVFKLMFATDGIINVLLVRMGILNEAYNFLGNAQSARIVLIISLIWRWTGYNMIFYASGLTSIDYALYEAASIDGANAWQRFWRITVPMLKPVILLTTIMATNGNLQLFDEPFNMTTGGPGTATISISQYIYKLAFQSAPNFGYASAIGFTLLLAIAILVWLQMKVGDKRG